MKHRINKKGNAMWNSEKHMVSQKQTCGTTMATYPNIGTENSIVDRDTTGPGGPDMNIKMKGMGSQNIGNMKE